MPVVIDALALISQSPVNWIAHLIILSALEVPATIFFGHWRRTPALTRQARVVGGLFLIRLVPLAAALLTGDDLVAMPPLDRAVSALTSLILIWVFAFPEALRRADTLMAGACLAVLVALGLAWALWAQAVAAGAAFYNATAQETGWEIAAILLLIAGLIVTHQRQPPGETIGVWVLALLLAGHIAHYLFPLANSSVPGAVRLVEVIGVPLATTIFYRRAEAAGLPALTGAAFPTKAATPSRPLATKSPLRQVLETFVVTAVFYFAIDLTLGRFQVDGPSMEPTLHSNQYVLVDKVSYLFSAPQRGDIVVFHHPLRSERQLIKRIIGLPGEQVLVEGG
ncbi:MAG TPA: signal peptidase I, partial [Rhodospirillales bacterium]